MTEGDPNSKPWSWMKIFEEAGTDCSGLKAAARRKPSFEDALASVKRMDARILATQESELQQVVDDFVSELEARVEHPSLYGTIPHA